LAAFQVSVKFGKVGVQQPLGVYCSLR